MDNANIFAVIEARAAAAGDAVCLRTADDTTFSYRDLEAITAGYARYLHEIGVGPGERVAVQVDKSPQNFFLYLAVLRLGAIYLPLNVGYTLAELAFFLADAEPTVFFCGEDAFHDKQELARQHGVSQVLLMRADGSGALDDCATDPSTGLPTQVRAADDTALILYTSGTTGQPKGAMLTHGNLQANAEALVARWQFTSADVLLHALPLFHAHGLFISCHCALFTASEILFLTRFEAADVIERLPRATVMMGVPTFYTRLLAEPGFDAHVARHVRVFISGSAPLTEQTSTAFYERTGHRILERYGMTETGIIASNPYDGERRVGSVGLPLEGVAVRVCDAQDRPLAADDVGAIQVAGHSVMAGYWRNPDKTAEEFSADGWFRTGDLGTIADDGYLSLAGRAKDLIISGGYNVYPKEVEMAIDALPGVRESAVVGAPHADFGEAVIAAVVADDGATLDAPQLITRLRDTLARYKIPKQVVQVDALPRNTMGKVLKNQLRADYADIFENEAT